MHAREPEEYESTDPMYPLSAEALAVMGIDLPEGQPRDWTATEMAAYHAAEVDLLREGSPPERSQPGVGAFAMRVTDT